MPRGTKRETPPPNGDPINVRPKGQPSAAELDYAYGRRNMPPRPHEMSADSQEHTATQFGERLSNVKTREQTFADSGAGGALKQPVIDRLVDKTMTVQTAGESLRRHWDIMMGAPDRPKPAWYFGHNRRTTRSANEYGIDPTVAIQAGGAMSPQNDPESEHTANRAMMDAHTRRRQVRATEDIYTVPTETEQKKGIKPRKVMVKGERRTLAAMHPDDMQAVTAAANAKKVTHAEDFNLPGFRKAGTGRKQGFGTLDPTTDYNAVDEMEAAKVHLYTDTTINSVPDSPLHHEYEMRFGDQDTARNVRLAREADAQPKGGLRDRMKACAGMTPHQQRAAQSGPGVGSEHLHGVLDRVDLYGLMRGTDDPTEEAYHHPILGVKGNAVPDTWMNTLLSDQEIEDKPDSTSPAKLMGSQSATTSSSIGPTSEGLQHTFPGPAEAAAHGGKPWSGDASFGMGSLMAMQHAAEVAREPESQTNIPPVMMQEMTWVHGRLRVAQSVRNMLSRSKGQPTSVAPGTAATRIAKLTTGDLAGEKEFRPSDASYRPNPNDAPGMFSRGYDNPLTRDEGISLIPAGSTNAAATAGSGTRRSSRNLAMSHFHEQAAGAPPTDAAKRAAILGAQAGYQASRAGGGAAWHEEPAKKPASDHPLSRGF